MRLREWLVPGVVTVFPFFPAGMCFVLLLQLVPRRSEKTLQGHLPSCGSEHLCESVVCRSDEECDPRRAPFSQVRTKQGLDTSGCAFLFLIPRSEKFPRYCGLKKKGTRILLLLGNIYQGNWNLHFFCDFSKPRLLVQPFFSLSLSRIQIRLSCTFWTVWHHPYLERRKKNDTSVRRV